MVPGCKCILKQDMGVDANLVSRNGLVDHFAVLTLLVAACKQVAAAERGA
jgi:hypothetical protein